MLLPILVIFFSCGMMQAMEEKPSCHAKQYILVKNLIKKYSISVEYDDKKTILDVKQEITEKKQIPVDTQRLIAVVPSTDLDFTHYNEITIKNLPDDLKIQEMIKNCKSGGTRLELLS